MGNIWDSPEQLGQPVSPSDTDKPGFTLAQKEPKRGRGRRGLGSPDRRNQSGKKLCKSKFRDWTLIGTVRSPLPRIGGEG